MKLVSVFSTQKSNLSSIKLGISPFSLTLFKSCYLVHLHVFSLTATQSHATWKKQQFRVIFSCNFITIQALCHSPVETQYSEQGPLPWAKVMVMAMFTMAKRHFLCNACQMLRGWPTDRDYRASTSVLDNGIKNVAIKPSCSTFSLFELWNTED